MFVLFLLCAISVGLAVFGFLRAHYDRADLEAERKYVAYLEEMASRLIAERNGMIALLERADRRWRELVRADAHRKIDWN